MRKHLEDIVSSLRRGEVPHLDPEFFPCFKPEALQGNEHVDAQTLDRIARSLGEADIPTFERAIRAIDEHDLAWLGFKIVYDPEAAQRNTDNEVTKKFGETGSADGGDLVFFCNDAKEIVAGRPYSPRDTTQMKDVTRGPSMHNDQFEGLTWLSAPLFPQVRVWLLGASDVACEVAALAHHVGFKVSVVDYDPAYINEDRFPDATRIALPGGNFDGLAEYRAQPNDLVCVLTRGHMFDTESCVWATRQHPRYIGMMGCAGKNGRIYDLAIAAGLTDKDWERIKRPIGLKFGAKTPAELAIAIVAELVDERYKMNYTEEARAKHEKSLNRE